MSMGLGKDKKKLDNKTKDQKEEKRSSVKESVTSAPQPLQTEVFDSSGDNAMSEMKEVADMGPDETTKVFHDVEGKEPLDPLTTNINDGIKKTDSDLTTLSPMTEPSLQEKNPRLIESNEAGMAPKQEAKSESPKVENESAGQNYLDESATVNSGNNVFFSDSSNSDIYNPFIMGIKFWQACNIAWINAYGGFLKAWIDNTKLIGIPYEKNDPL
jgi:hypothetical protein